MNVLHDTLSKHVSESKGETWHWSRYIDVALLVCTVKQSITRTGLCPSSRKPESMLAGEIAESIILSGTEMCFSSY
jgi:hypothetical protein